MEISHQKFLGPKYSKTTQFLLLLVSGILFGLIVYFLLMLNIPARWSIVILIGLTMPFLAIWTRDAKHFFLAVLLLTLPFNIDITLAQREHIGGPAGFIISLHNIALVFLFSFWILDILNKRMDTIYFYKRLSLPIYGIILVSILSMVNAYDPMLSLFHLIEIIKMYLIFVYIVNYVARVKSIRFIVFFLLLGLILESILATMQSLFSSSFILTELGTRAETSEFLLGETTVRRVGGTLGGANPLAVYINFLLPLPLTLLFYKTKKSTLFILFITLCISIYALFLTYSRAGWICLFVSIIIVLYFHIKQMTIRKKTMFSIVLIMLFCILGYSLLTTSNVIRGRFIEDDRGSANVRLPLMEVAVNMIKSHPLIGVGLNNYAEVDQDYDTTVEKVTIIFPSTVHNIYLKIATEIGIPGLLFFLWFVFYVYLHAFKFMRHEKGFDRNVVIGIIAGLTAFLIHGLVDTGNLGGHRFLTFWVMSGIVIGLHESIPSALQSSKKRK